MEIRSISKSQRAGAIELAGRVFMEFEAPDYSREGIEAFFDTALRNEDFLNRLTIYGAFEGNELVGMIATRQEGRHIALFFVEGKYHRQGIGRRLFCAAAKNCTADEMTVNASPYAVEVYRRLGFYEMGGEETVTGIRFTPMVYKKNRAAAGTP